MGFIRSYTESFKSILEDVMQAKRGQIRARIEQLEQQYNEANKENSESLGIN